MFQGNKDSLIRRCGRRRARARLAGMCGLAVVLAIAATSNLCAQNASAAKPRILILNSYHYGYLWSDSVVDGAREVLFSQLGEPEIYVEFMDTKRTASPTHIDLLYQSYKLKYKNTRFDAILSSDDSALEFLLTNADEIFPETPVVFCGVNNYDANAVAHHRWFTGLAGELDVQATLDVALRLQPDVKNVYVISDDSLTGLGERKSVIDASREYPGLAWHYLNGEDYTEAELLDKLRSLPPESIVLLTIWLKDNTGKYIPNDLAGRNITSASPAPVYALTDIWLGDGIVGGKLNTGRVQGRLAGRQVVRIIRYGVRPWNMPVSRAAPSEYLFDYNAMRRFDIPPDRLPPDATVINRPFSFYRVYKQLVWGVGTVIAVLLTLVTGLAVSIVKRRRAEAVLRESEARFRKIFQTSPDSISITRMSDSVVVDVNDAFLELTGWGRQEVIGHTKLDLGIWKDPAQREAWMKRLAEQGSASGVEFQIARPDGQVRTALVSANVIALGRVPHVLALARDITDQKLAEQHRRQMEQRIQHAQKLESLGILAGGIAHDFNNLLVGILGNAELALRDLPNTSPAHDSVDGIRHAAIRASELTSQMLAYAGKGRFVVEPLDINELVREMGQLLHASIPRKAALLYDLTPGLPPIEADASQIRQVVMNLITNAADAIAGGEGVIKVSTAVVEASAAELAATCINDELPGGTYVLLEVADTGCGMDKQTRARIFEPFFTTKSAGRGLGMSAVLGIVRGHDGALTVDSEPGKGSTFHVLLPASKRQVPPARRAAEPSRQAGDGAAVLVVDDEPSVRKVASVVLESAGYRVLTAVDGAEGVEIFAAQPGDIDVVLLDSTMPRMSGEEALREIRRIRPDARVILCSGYDEQDALARHGKEVVGFLKKPFQIADLLAKVAQALRAPK